MSDDDQQTFRVLVTLRGKVDVVAQSHSQARGRAYDSAGRGTSTGWGLTVDDVSVLDPSDARVAVDEDSDEEAYRAEVQATKHITVDAASRDEVKEAVMYEVHRPMRFRIAEVDIQ